MKKPLNTFAFALGLAAIFYAALIIPDIVEIIRQPKALVSSALPESANYVKSFAFRDIIVAVRNTVYGSGVLLGLAATVEMADRILWAISQRDRTVKL
jgi:hypothetical protein